MTGRDPRSGEVGFASRQRDTSTGSRDNRVSSHARLPRPRSVGSMKALALLFVTGCVVGGGPLVGYDRHGWFGGVEAGGGGALILPQGAIGYQTRRHLLYARVDETWDLSGLQHIGAPSPMGGGRIGAGLGIDVSEGDVGGTFVIGPSIGRVLGPIANCSNWNTEALLEVQLRYAIDWQLVLATRIERARDVCGQ